MKLVEEYFFAPSRLQHVWLSRESQVNACKGYVLEDMSFEESPRKAYQRLRQQRHGLRETRRRAGQVSVMS